MFAVIAPGNVVANLAAGAISEAGAQQAGDMMQVGPAFPRGLCQRVIMSESRSWLFMSAVISFEPLKLYGTFTELLMEAVTLFESLETARNVHAAFLFLKDVVRDCSWADKSQLCIRN